MFSIVIYDVQERRASRQRIMCFRDALLSAQLGVESVSATGVCSSPSIFVHHHCDAAMRPIVLPPPARLLVAGSTARWNVMVPRR